MGNEQRYDTAENSAICLPIPGQFHNLCVLVICCCVTNYHCLGGLKQYPFISLQVYRLEVRHNVAGFSLRVSQGQIKG